MNLFGKKKAPPPPPAANPVDTIQMLSENLTVLQKREAHIMKKIEATILEAKTKMAKKDKNGALFALKRKKMYENEVSKLQGAQITLDTQILALENATVNIETFKAMKAGANAMKSVRGQIDADAVDDMMDEIQDEKDIHDSISEAISRPGQELFDDEELLAELAELDALELDSPPEAAAAAPTYAPSVPQSVFNLPSVPSAQVTPAAAASVAESEDERALRELEASMLA